MKWWRWAACTFSAPSATKPAASIISCAAAPAARAIPGSSRFFLSLEDDLLRIFGGEKVKNLMFRLGMTEGVPIESRMISNRIENAQKAVEAQNFEARKHLLEYDDVMNKQRETIYNLRRSFLEGRDQQEFVLERADAIADELVETYCPREQHPDQWNTTQFSNEVLNQFGFDPKAAGMDFASLNHDNRRIRADRKAARALRGKRKDVRRADAALARAPYSCSTSSTASGKTTCSRSTT